MRLLHVTEYRLDSFVEAGHDATPGYAILSHTWGEGEILFEDMTSPERVKASAMKKSAWTKVQRSCEEARATGYDYVWIDTLCIDKSSSAELSEAINSMFAWYALSGLCIAFIADYDSSDLSVGDTQDRDGSPGRTMDAFLTSRWFTRGWTLQELIAPAEMSFYDRNWRSFGTRASLAETIENRTSIYYGVLGRPIFMPPEENRRELRRILPTVSIAARMSWVAERKTTRSEDIAYCMLGLFDVNMPLLYGEGKVKAFTRLQEEIIHQSFDATLLCWKTLKHDQDSGQPRRWEGVLAPSPYHFAQLEHLELLRDNSKSFQRPFPRSGAVHPDGVVFTAILCPIGAIRISQLRPLSRYGKRAIANLSNTRPMSPHHPDGIFLLILPCVVDGDYTRRVALYVARLGPEKPMHPQQYTRLRAEGVVVEMGMQYSEQELELQRPRSHFNKARMEQVILSGTRGRPLVPSRTFDCCVYELDAANTGDEWRLIDLLECKPMPALNVWLPSWDRHGDGKLVVSRRHVTDGEAAVKAVALIERKGEDAFFVLMGVDYRDIPSETCLRPRPERFCFVATWQQLMGYPYTARDAEELMSECRQVAFGKKRSPFLNSLLMFCTRVLAGQPLSDKHQIQFNELAVSAQVSRKEFMEICGSIIYVGIGGQVSLSLRNAVAEKVLDDGHPHELPQAT